ncbi:MAG: protein kinase [Deltaproteobacteria bacterium]|nr:protein kinase [Deltaproteobacteria bacterium]
MSGNSGVTDAANATATPEQVVVGSRVGHYRILAPLGEGGMGAVFLAEHDVIGRKAAIKVLQPLVARDDEAVSRFFMEARAVNQIRHPNIVEVTDFGTENGQPFIVMEYLEGETLSSRLNREGRFEPLGAVHVIRQVASALGAAHDRGLVHRDLKPGNIMLLNHPDYPDFVKVLDFGIAKLTVGQDPNVGHHTRVGVPIGTPAYMSPEQCLGEPDVDQRSDIYSMGVVFYGLLTGKLPFRDGPLGQVILAHVQERPKPPVDVNPRVGHVLSDLVMKTLEKRRQDRFASMKDFRDALDGIVGVGRTNTSPGGVPIIAAFSEGGARGGGVGDAAQRTSAGLGPRELQEPAFPDEATRPIADPRPSLVQATAPTKEDTLFERLRGIVHERLESDKFSLPRLSAVTEQCLEALRLPGFAFGNAATLVSPDTMLARKIVRLANSVAFSSVAPAITLEQSIGRLGADGLQKALVEFSSKPIYMSKYERVREAFRRPWYHALATAMIAERLCEVLELKEQALQLYLAAILHDIGKPVVGGFLLSVEEQTAGLRGRRWMTDELWLRVITATWRSVSVAVARAWHLPDSVIGILTNVGNKPMRDERATSVVLRLALAFSARDGFYLRQADLYNNAQEIEAAKSLLSLDNAKEQRALHQVRERVTLLAKIRGG